QSQRNHNQYDIHAVCSSGSLACASLAEVWAQQAGPAFFSWLQQADGAVSGLSLQHAAFAVPASSCGRCDCSRPMRSALSTTTKEPIDMQMAASQGGMKPSAANGMAVVL